METVNKSKELSFSSQQLLVDNKPPIFDDFKNFEKSFTPSDTIEGEFYHTISTELTEQYFWLYSMYGKAIPCPKKVYNIKNESREDNPRQHNQIEQDNQFFLLYSFSTQILYISNTRMKKFIETLFKDIIKKKFVLKMYLKILKNFARRLSLLKKLIFAQ